MGIRNRPVKHYLRELCEGINSNVIMVTRPWTHLDSFGWLRTMWMIFPGGYIGVCSARSIGAPPLRQCRPVRPSGRRLPRAPVSIPADVAIVSASQHLLWNSISVMIVFHWNGTNISHHIWMQMAKKIIFRKSIDVYATSACIHISRKGPLVILHCWLTEWNSIQRVTSLAPA